VCGIGGAHAREERHTQTRVAELLRRHLPAAVFAAALENAPRTALAGLLAKQPGTRSPVKRLARTSAFSGQQNTTKSLSSRRRKYGSGRPGQGVRKADRRISSQTASSLGDLFQLLFAQCHSFPSSALVASVNFEGDRVRLPQRDFIHGARRLG
jgi:hypothetical protein